MSLPSWMHDRACLYLDPAKFDPPEGTPEARLACQFCPVVEECLSWLISWPDQAGYGAGMSEWDRQRYARTRAGKQHRVLARQELA